MYVGDDVSPDFYAWVFPKYDHVGVGTGTVVDRPSIKKYQAAIRTRAAEKLAGGKIIKIEAHPIPEHPRPRRRGPHVPVRRLRPRPDDLPRERDAGRRAGGRLPGRRPALGAGERRRPAATRAGIRSGAAPPWERAPEIGRSQRDGAEASNSRTTGPGPGCTASSSAARSTAL